MASKLPIFERLRGLPSFVWLGVGLAALFLAILIATSARRAATSGREAQAAERERIALAALEESNRVAQAERDARNRESREAQAKKDQESAIERAKEETQRHIDQSLRTTKSLKASGKIGLAISVVDHGGDIDEPLSSIISEAFASGDVETGQLFTQTFATQGGLSRLQQSDRGEIRALRLAALSDYLLVGKYSVDCSTNAEMENLVTAAVRIEGGVIRAADGSLVESFSFDSAAAGTSAERALSGAKENLGKRFSTRTWKFLRQ